MSLIMTAIEDKREKEEVKEILVDYIFTARDFPFLFSESKKLFLNIKLKLKMKSDMGYDIYLSAT